MPFKLHRAIASAIGLLLVAAAGPYAVNWPGLEKAWSEYLEAPSASTGSQIVELLPRGQRASHRADDVNVQAAVRILDGLGALERIIATGALHSFEVAFALQEISDGEYSEWLSEMLGASIRTHPLPLLSSLKENQARASVSCLFASAAHPDEFETPEKYAAEILARRFSLSVISSPEVKEQAACLIAELDRALAR